MKNCIHYIAGNTTFGRNEIRVMKTEKIYDTNDTIRLSDKFLIKF